MPKPKNENQIVFVEASQLKQHPDNPRKGNIAILVESIKENGFYGALIVQRSTNHIIAGNHRFQALQECKIDPVPVIYIDCTDKQAKKMMLVDNRSNDVAGYNTNKLLELVSEFSNDNDLFGTGFTEDDLNNLIDSLTTNYEPNVAPETSHREVTDQDVANTKMDVDGENKAMVKVLCPHCGEEFFLSKEALSNQ